MPENFLAPDILWQNKWSLCSVSHIDDLTPRHWAGGGRDLVHQQPWQKAWGDEPGVMGIWTLTEPAIYYQAAYIELLAEFVDR